MTRQEHLKFCSVCTHQKFDPKQGIICGLSCAIADFDPTCPDYSARESLVEKAVEKERRERNKSVGLTTRFINFIIDRLVMQAIQFSVGIFIGLLAYTLNLGALIETLDTAWITILLALAIYYIYYVAGESLFGQTVGKLLTGTIVVDKEGNKPSFGVILLRTTVRLIPFNAISFLFDSNSGWHDQFSNTTVIKKPRRKKVG